MDWKEKHERRKKSQQANMRISTIDAENLQTMLDHLNKDSSPWSLDTKSDAYRKGVDLYLEKNKLKRVTE